MSQEPANAAGADRRALIERLFETSRDLLFMVGPDGRLTLVNPAWTAALGWTEAELVGRYVSELIHPDDMADFGAHVMRLIETGASENFARVRTKDGGWRWLHGRAQVGPDGGMTGVLRDATQDQAQAEALERARRATQTLSEAAGVGTWSYEPGPDRVDWSEDILAIVGYAQEEVQTADQFEALLHPDERGMVRRRFIEGVARGVGGTFEHRLRARDGRWTTWRMTLRTEPRPDGTFALRGLSQNITELAEARDAAQRGEQQIRQLIEAAPFAVAMFDRQMRYMMVSPRWVESFNLAGRAHIGRHLAEVFPNIPKRLLAAARRALNGEVVTRSEDRFVDSQGVGHWTRWEARPWREASGEIGGILAYIDDISALAKARREAQVNARRLKLALSAADAGVYEIDQVARTFWTSPEFKKVTGATSRNYEDAHALRLPAFHPDDVGQVREIFRAIRDGRRSSGDAFEARVIKPSGEERWVRIFHHIETDRNGKAVRAVGLVFDFDERKRQELALVEAERAAQAAAEAKAAFLANMSHEIRTPMNGVMGVLHLLKNEGLSDDGRKMLEEALSCGQMLAELLNDVIDFSKIEAGRLELAYEPVDPAALAEGVVRLLGPQAVAKGLVLAVEADPGLGWVRADPVRLRQALFNLVGNAVKFTVEGSVTVRARLREDARGPRLRFEVEDTGVGIPKAVQARIFQRFDQGDASTTRRFGGSGLGLSITKRLAELMEGEVGFSSDPGVGSTFWIEIGAEAAEAPREEGAAMEMLLDGLRILVVEDNPTNRMIATKLLEGLGASVETAADGLLGVEAASRGAFDLILMDVQMPGIDGPEAARRIRALPGPAAQVPIIALTANVLAHQRQAYLEAGMNGVVGKPISPVALIGEIARLAEPSAPDAASAVA